MFTTVNKRIPIYVRNNTSMQYNVLMFALQCMYYATIHQCNAMSSCLHSNVCTQQYINAIQCPHVCIPMCVHDWFGNRSGSLKKVIFKKLFRVKLEKNKELLRLKPLLRFLIKKTVYQMSSTTPGLQSSSRWLVCMDFDNIDNIVLFNGYRANGVSRPIGKSGRIISRRARVDHVSTDHYLFLLTRSRSPVVEIMIDHSREIKKKMYFINV